MKFNDLLPIGSVVLLKNAQKKITVIGLMPIKHTEAGKDIIYDYIGVPYPEGYIWQESAMIFNHISIEETIFVGYSNNEREQFVDVIQKLVEKTHDTIITNAIE